MKDANEFNAPEGVKIKPMVLVMINHYWGKAKTIEAAWKNVQIKS